jgi:hypothetical protein
MRFVLFQNCRSVNPSPENLPVRPEPGAKEMDSFRFPGELNNTMLRRVEVKIKLTTPAEHQPIPDSSLCE